MIPSVMFNGHDSLSEKCLFICFANFFLPCKFFLLIFRSILYVVILRMLRICLAWKILVLAVMLARLLVFEFAYVIHNFIKYLQYEKDYTSLGKSMSWGLMIEWLCNFYYYRKNRKINQYDRYKVKHLVPYSISSIYKINKLKKPHSQYFIFVLLAWTHIGQNIIYIQNANLAFKIWLY